MRFHMYWAGADQDGSVAGFFFAVVETLPVPPEGGIILPSLPGPKARDYHFTTKTDSIFVFTASEDVSERQHAFYLYAVDDKGRPDATPARFIFSAYDRFPPLAIVDELKAVGTIYRLLPGGGVTSVERTYFVRDSFEITVPGTPTEFHLAPRDTIPARAQIFVRWHGEPTIPSTVIKGFRYKLDEANFNFADSSVHTAAYNTGIGLDKITPGQKIFTLRALGQSGWRGESTRWFQMNFAPDTWFAGPDPSDPLAGWQTMVDGRGKRYWFIDFSSSSWEAFAGIPGSYLSADSALVLPALRRERKSFFEIYNDRLWLRQEGDTVNLNSWVVFPSGGFDQDSPYSVRVNVPLLPPSLVGLPVTTPSGPNGSPIGFRIRIEVKGGTVKSNLVDNPSETTTYPVIDPASVFHQPRMNGYVGLTNAGRAFAVARAEDGDGTVDRRVDQRPGGAVGIVERVEAGTGSAEDRALRSKILTFFVDRAPVLLTTNAAFIPRTTTTYTTRTLNLVLPASDGDQLDPLLGFARVGGTPTYAATLRRRIAVLGVNAAGDSVCYVEPQEFFAGNNISITIPATIKNGPIKVRIRLCDCAQCNDLQWPNYCAFERAEPTPSQGRCVDTDILCRLNVLAPEPTSIQGGGDVTQRPGSPSDTGRRKQP